MLSILAKEGTCAKVGSCANISCRDTIFCQDLVPRQGHPPRSRAKARSRAAAHAQGLYLNYTYTLHVLDPTNYGRFRAKVLSNTKTHAEPMSPGPDKMSISCQDRSAAQHSLAMRWSYEASRSSPRNEFNQIEFHLASSAVILEMEKIEVNPIKSHLAWSRSDTGDGADCI